MSTAGEVQKYRGAQHCWGMRPTLSSRRPPSCPHCRQKGGLGRGRAGEIAHSRFPSSADHRPAAQGQGRSALMSSPPERSPKVCDSRAVGAFATKIHADPAVPGTHSSRHSPQAAGVGAEGTTGKLEGPGSAFCGCVGSRGAGSVSPVGRLECHMTWPVGPSAGVGQAGGSTVEFLSSHPGGSTGPSVTPGRELWVGLGVLLAIHWPVPRPGAWLGTSSSAPCAVLFLSSPTMPLPPLLGGDPGVRAWPDAGVPHRCPGLGDRVGVSGPKAVVSMPRAGAVTVVTGDSTLPGGLTTSPAGTYPLSEGVSETPKQSPLDAPRVDPKWGYRLSQSVVMFAVTQTTLVEGEGGRSPY